MNRPRPRSADTPNAPQAGKERPVREWLRQGARRVLPHLRPHYLVIGAMKSGTSHLHTRLVQHPHILRPARKELHFFDTKRYGKGPGWYFGRFPTLPTAWVHRLRTGRWPVVGEATPRYLFFSDVPARVRALIPEVRLIALLRDPVDRAYSHYWHMVRIGREPLSFDAAIEAELGSLDSRAVAALDNLGHHPQVRRYGYVARGLYAEQLRRWLVPFPAQQLLVLNAQDLRDDDAGVLSRVFAHLGLPDAQLPPRPDRLTHEHPPMSSELRVLLEQVFAGPNRELASLLAAYSTPGWRLDISPFGPDRAEWGPSSAPP